MSEPLSSNEIEDVVSSVRRLVSNEPRPRPLTQDLGPDKLLLTPSLRVVADNPVPNPPPGTAANPSPMTPLILTNSVATDATDDRLHLVEAEWEDEIWTEPEPPLAELALGAEEAEVLTADPVPTWPETAGATPEVSVSDPATAWPEAEADWSDDPAATAFLAEDAKPAPAEDQDDDVDVAEVLTAAVVEDAAFQRLNQTELHALVRAMVREELQGNLGERITRNVRKLVRAEIKRALAARDLG
jgi:hypothetical protein